MKMNIPKFIMKCAGAFGYLVQYGCIAHCLFEYGGDFVVCSGPSMEPTIHTNDVVITEHISVIRRLIQKGDIVIAHSPSNPNQYICKRVTATEYDYVTNTRSNNQSISYHSVLAHWVMETILDLTDNKQEQAQEAKLLTRHQNKSAS